MSQSQAHFSPALFRFIKDLKAHNERDWFQANKSRFEDDLREPSLQFISDFGPKLQKISPHFNAIPKSVGGSLFRIYRDVRFSKDKSPYKTHVGIHFRHKKHKTAHAPGFYLHLEPKECFVGAGIWRPDPPALKKIRAAIEADPAGWKRASRSKRFTSRFELSGESLKRPPKGVDPEHRFLDDLKRKDFIAVTSVRQSDVTKAGFLDEFTKICKDGAPLVKWLCGALEVEF